MAEPSAERLLLKLLLATLSVALVGTETSPFQTTPALEALRVTVTLEKLAVAPAALYSAAPMAAVLLIRRTWLAFKKPPLYTAPPRASRTTRLSSDRWMPAATVNTAVALPPLRMSRLLPSRLTLWATVLRALTVTVVGTAQLKVALPPAARALSSPASLQAQTVAGAASPAAAAGRRPASSSTASASPSPIDSSSAGPRRA